MKKQVFYLYTRITLTLLSFCFGLDSTFAQQDTVYNTYNNETEISARKSVMLKPGFFIPAGKNVRVFIKSGFSTPMPFSGVASSTQNYIATKTFKIPNIFSAEQVNAPHTTNEVNQTIAYFDGLGRPLQTVNSHSSPNGKDIISPVVYDIFGREAIKYQPYAASTGVNGSYRPSALAEQAAYYQQPGTGIKPTNSPFSVTVFEDSPISRPIEQGFQGTPWQPVPGSPAGHTVKTDYQVNVATDEVKLWEVVSTRGARSLSNYLPGRLYKTVIKNENWTNGKAGTIEEFKNNLGQIVLKRRWETESKSLSTYFIFDDLNNLRYVLPPGVNENGQNLNSFSEQDNVFNEFIYGYFYDGRKQVVEKKVPGKGWEYIVYNSLGKVVMTQDANQRGKSLKEWFFTKYDAHGRVVLTGVCVNGNSREVNQNAVNSLSVNHLPLWEVRDDANQTANNTGYTNRTFPTENINAYYTINYYDDYNFLGNTFGNPDGITQVNDAKVKGLPTGSYVYLLGGSQRLLSVVYYDKYSQVVQTKSQNHLNGTDVVDNTFNFSGELVVSKRTHIKGGSSVPLIIATKYRYDHVGRKVATIKQINGQAEVVINNIDYNDLGQIIKNKLHSTDSISFLNFTDYAYNERGWLKSAISAEFSERLNYEDGATSQWNGLISNQLWGQTTATPYNFTYTYDKLNRLINSVSTGVMMSEAMTYDLVGNINTLSRDNGAANQYRYQGSRLSSIDNIAGSYNYDYNGNAIKDGRTGVDLTYNAFNLPATVVHPASGLALGYLYDSKGTKLRKTSSTLGTTDYCSGIQYQDGVIEFIQTEIGIARNNGGNYTYEYNLTDHLGNVRVTFNKDVSNGSVKRLQEDNYYAFGLRKVATAGPNNYLYTGKELQNELGQYDYGARFYDPVIGRWNVVDPLAEKFVNINPYSFTDNNPVNNIDPNGMETYYGNEAIQIVAQIKAALTQGRDESDDEKNRYKVLKNGDLEADRLEGVEIKGTYVSAWQAYQDKKARGLSNEEIFNGPRGDEIRSYIDNYAKYAGWGTNNPMQQAVYEVATFYAYGELGGFALKAFWNFGKGIFAAKAAIETTSGVTAEGAVWAQKTFGKMFSDYGTFAGQTVEGVAERLRSGALSVADVSIDLVVRNGETFILNTRSSAALMKAGIPRSAWNVVDRTGIAKFEDMLTGQLTRNGLTKGVNTIRQSGTQIVLSH